MFRRLFLIGFSAAMLSLPAFAVDIPAGTVASCNYETLKTYEDGATVVLKAVWEPNKYTVTYDKGEHATPESSGYVDINGATYDTNYTVPSAASSSIVPARGYRFVGFNTESGQSVANFPDLLTMPWSRTENLTVYAAYVSGDTNVVYNCGRSEVNADKTGKWIGTAGANSVDLLYDATYGHPIGEDSCTLMGYDFDSWYCVSGTESKISGGTKHPTDGIVDEKWSWDVANVTCTATWTPKTYSCGAGYYLGKFEETDTVRCTRCPAGSYCPGFNNIVYNESEYGKSSCPDGYTSDEGNASKSKCYRTSTVSCATVNSYNGGHGTAVYATETVSCKEYFGNESNCIVAESDKANCAIIDLNCEEPEFEKRTVDGALACVRKSVECPVGKYLPANSTDSNDCAECLKDNYCAGGTFEPMKTTAQGITGCPDGLKAPNGASSIKDCGKLMHINGDVLYLHKDKRGPSLVVDIKGTKWYADATPLTEGAKKISGDTDKEFHVMVGDKEHTVHTSLCRENGENCQ